MELTHKKLTEIAKYWLKSSKQCNPVFSEQGSANFSEMPDAIGFQSSGTIVAECKTSKSDLYADRKKPFRDFGGLGTQRFYVMPKALFLECADYDFRGWGVVVVDEHGQARKARNIDSAEFKSNIINERHFLRSRILEVQRFGS